MPLSIVFRKHVHVAMPLFDSRVDLLNQIPSLPVGLGFFNLLALTQLVFPDFDFHLISLSIFILFFLVFVLFEFPSRKFLFLASLSAAIGRKLAQLRGRSHVALLVQLRFNFALLQFVNVQHDDLFFESSLFKQVIEVFLNLVLLRPFDSSGQFSVLLLG